MLSLTLTQATIASLQLELQQKKEVQVISSDCSRYNKFFNSNEFSDYTCVSSNGTSIPVHSVILAGQSPVLHAMFNSKMKESQTKTIKISDIDATVLLEMLRFVYTGRVENLEANASSLIMAADKYDMGDLKNLCTSSLIKSLSTANIFDTVNLADRCNDKFLLYECIEFIKE
jgi:speckle-type POZ protein